jgi:signal transduction histidine kinase/ActR/RegA family two-component response regulator
MKRILLIASALFLLLTFLFVQTMPNLDSARNKRDLIREIVDSQATLQKLILSARAGLLANDDPIVATLDTLRGDVDALQNLPDLTPASSVAIGKLHSLIQAQEERTFNFTAESAIVRNSLAYFAFLVSQGSGATWSDPAAIQRIGTAMMTLTINASNAAQRQVATLLDELDQKAADGRATVDDRTIAAHGRMIQVTLPVVDGLLQLLTNDAVGQQSDAVQRILSDELEATERMTALWRAVLYGVALILVGILVYFYQQLRRSARLLDLRSRAVEARLAFEQMIVGLSNALVGIPAEHVDRAIEDGLGMIARRLGADRIYFMINHNDYGGYYFAAWPPGHEQSLEAWAALTDDLRRTELADLHDGITRVDRRSLLKPGYLRDMLEKQGVHSWLAVPVAHQSAAIGLLGLDRLKDEQPWPRENLGLLRMVGDILLQALSGRHATSERETLTGRLHHAQRVQAIGTIAGGVAHNFNNILGAIMGYSEMALDHVEPGSKAANYIQEVRGSGKRAAEVIDQILRFSRQGDRQRRELGVVALLQETIRLLRVTLPSGVVLDTKLPDHEIAIFGDPAELQQIVMNLANNAAQASDGSGSLSIVLTDEVFTEVRQLSHGRLPAESYIRISVADNGTGMDEVTKARLFEPFFTTKAAGTGLGLATIFAIVTEHGGAINVESTPGQGTVFDVYLPRNMAAAVAAAPSGINFQGNGEVVIIVDDEVGLLHLSEEFVAALGCEPVGFADPLLALQAIETDPNRYDLLLTDEVMPRMKGIELASRVHEVAPNLPIVLMTGLLELPSIDLIQRAGITEIVRKPLLANDVRSVLARQLRADDAAASESGDDSAQVLAS